VTSVELRALCDELPKGRTTGHGHRRSANPQSEIRDPQSGDPQLAYSTRTRAR
jgi:hypothetical protein